MIFIGIDPGKHGALAAIHVTDAGAVSEYQEWDCPLDERGQCDVAGMTKIVYEEFSGRDCRATIERVNSFAGEGHMGAFRFGLGYGLWQGILAGFCIPFELVLPREWQRMVLPPETIFANKAKGQHRDKGQSLSAARKLFPEAELTLKKHDGRAEALLIAEYGRRKYRFTTAQAGRWNAVHG